MAFTKFEGRSLARRRPVNFSDFPISIHLSVNLPGRQTSRRGSREKMYRQMYGKLKKDSSPTSTIATSFKLDEYNLLPNIQRFDSEIVKNAILEKGICHRIPIQTL